MDRYNLRYRIEIHMQHKGTAQNIDTDIKGIFLLFNTS